MKKVLLIVLMILVAMPLACADTSFSYIRAYITSDDYVARGQLMQANLMLERYSGGNFDDVQVLILVDDMDLYDLDGPFDFRSNIGSRQYFIRIPIDAKPGFHYLHMIIYSEDGTKHVFKEFKVV